MCSTRIVSFVAILLAASSALAQAPSDTRQRQAAAEAYDQGTAAYLSQDFEKAAQWFETANRMSPAAPALIQAARSHQQAGHFDRAATLALRLTLEHADDANAMQFGEGVLNQLAGKFVRIDVSCEHCKLDIDGTLQESPSFFVDPDVTHTVTASFETGEQRGDVSGQAGETKTLEFVAPPPAEVPIIDEKTGLPLSGTGPRDDGPKPLRPIFTFIGAGITAALVAGSIASTVDMNAGVEPYKVAAKKWTTCAKDMGLDPCKDLQSDASKKLKDGQSKETRTTALWIATGAVAAGTGVIALFLTDWSGWTKKEPKDPNVVSFGAAPTLDGAALWMTGRF